MNRIGISVLAKKMLVDSFYSFFIKVSAAVLGFFISIVITRGLGAEVAGVYFYAISLLSLFISVSVFGLNTALLRILPSFIVDRKFKEAKGVVYSSALFVVSLSLVICIFVFVFKGLIPFENKYYLSGFLVILWSLPFMALIVIFSHALQAENSIKIAMLISGALQNAILILVLLAFNITTLFQLSLTYTLSVVFVFLFAFSIWSFRNRNYIAIKPGFRNELKLAFPIFKIQIASELSVQAPLLILGAFSDSDSIVFFAICQRIALMVNFVYTPVNRVLAPQLSKFHHSNNRSLLEYSCQLSTKILIIGGLPPLLFMIILPEYILMFFGGDFGAEASLLLRILALSQVVNILTGPVDTILQMTGHQLILRKNVYMSLVIVLIGCGMLIPLIGSMGAAISVLFSQSFVNIKSYVSVKRHIGISAFKLF